MQNAAPLAERMRPTSLENYIGQKHIVGEGAILRTAIESNLLPSIILWGPPGVGKAKSNNLFSQSNPILFIDEIHRFSKSQQDSLLGAVEKGTITLIGATTENPSFEVISALLSRCQVYILKPLDKDDLLAMLDLAMKTDSILKTKSINIVEYEALLRLSGGDGRKLLNVFELVINTIGGNKIEITNEKVTNIVQQNIAIYDKAGENHYDIISAFIKSIDRKST